MKENITIRYYSPEDTYPIPFPQTNKETKDEQIRIFIRNFLPKLIEQKKQKQLKNEIKN